MLELLFELGLIEEELPLVFSVKEYDDVFSTPVANPDRIIESLSNSDCPVNCDGSVYPVDDRTEERPVSRLLEDDSVIPEVS